MLSTALLSLSGIVLSLSFELGLAVTSDTSKSTLDGTSSTVANATSQVVELALGFLRLALEALFLATLLETLYRTPELVW